MSLLASAFAVLSRSTFLAGTFFSAGKWIRPGNFALYIAMGNANCEKFYDVIDENVNLPLLCISSEETDPHRTVGYFSMTSRIEVS